MSQLGGKPYRSKFDHRRRNPFDVENPAEGAGKMVKNPLADFLDQENAGDGQPEDADHLITDQLRFEYTENQHAAKFPGIINV